MTEVSCKQPSDSDDRGYKEVLAALQMQHQDVVQLLASRVQVGGCGLVYIHLQLHLTLTTCHHGNTQSPTVTLTLKKVPESTSFMSIWILFIFKESIH